MPELTMTGVEIIDPTVRPADAIIPAPRLHTLSGRRIGFLDNSKEKAGVFLTALGERLAERFALGDVVHVRKPSYSRLAPPEVLEDLAKRCDAVVTAMGA